MKLDNAGTSMLTGLEGVVLHVYLDQANLPTIGVGHLLTPKELETKTLRVGDLAVPLLPPSQNSITTSQALAVLRQDAEWAERCVTQSVAVSISQHEFNALTSFVFNVGATAFTKSGLLRKLNASLFDTVPSELRKWNKIHINGKVVVSPGLTTRREAEVREWLQP